MRAEIVEVVADLPGDVVADHARGDLDRVGNALRVRPAVTLHDKTVEAEENRAVVIVGVKVNLQEVERRGGESKARFRALIQR